MPVTTLLIYILSTPAGAPPLRKINNRLSGWIDDDLKDPSLEPPGPSASMMLIFAAILLARWTTLAVIVRQKEALARFGCKMAAGGSLMKKGLIAYLLMMSLVAPALRAQVALPACPAATCAQRSPDATRGLDIKYVRDSAEYATLSRQVYRIATMAVARNRPASGTWGVILDIDETTLDNSQYQLERGIYGLGYDDASWASWVQRAEARTVPGVKDFLDDVRRSGGRVIFITDRYTEYIGLDGSRADLLKATRDNLTNNGLMVNADLLCLKTNPNDSKAARRQSVKDGSGICSWSGTSVQVVAFVGDQMTDFPQKGELFTAAGMDKEFGNSFFLLPQPMYGRWTNAVTREISAFK